MSNQNNESVQLFFKSFQKHLMILRDGDDKSNQSFRANILVSQLRQFEKAVMEFEGDGPKSEGEHALIQSLLNVETLEELFKWFAHYPAQQAKIDSIFFRSGEGNWDLIYGDSTFKPIRISEWIDRGLLGRLDCEEPVYAVYAFAQPRVLLVFAGKEEAGHGEKIQLGRLAAKLLPLFLTAPVKERTTIPGSIKGLIARDRKFLELLALIGKAAVTDVSILLEGESGTGKEVIANYIHNCSPRSGKPLIAVNCAAIPAGLMESELFGHEKGSFTGAHNRHIGQVEQANGGTLFLDEIGEMDLPMQAKLLRFLQLKEFHRVGGKQKVSVDVRIVAATNRDLKEQVSEGNFREDLYYRLSVMPFRVPALRERIADILPLAEFFFEKYSEVFGFGGTEIDPMVFQTLGSYDFPGNVRELENLIQNILVVSQGRKITTSHLPEALQGHEPQGETMAHSNAPGLKSFRMSNRYNKAFRTFRRNSIVRSPKIDGEPMPWLHQIPEDNDELKKLKGLIQDHSGKLTLELEKRFLDQLLLRADGSMPKASKLAGINRTLLYKMLERTKALDE